MANEPIMTRLKEATDDLHRMAEGRELQKAMVKGVLPHEQYVAFLGQMYLVHQALEGRIDAVSGEHRAFGSVVRDYHHRCDELRADLDFYGASVADFTPVPATARFLASIDALAQSTPVALLGMLYVLEGSTNGARFIAAALQRAWDMQPGAGLAYLDPHGDQQRPRWQAFKDDMNAVGFDEREQAALVEAARSTFQAIADISDELYEPAIA